MNISNSDNIWKPQNYYFYEIVYQTEFFTIFVKYSAQHWLVAWPSLNSDFLVPKLNHTHIENQVFIICPFQWIPMLYYLIMDL